MFSSHSLYTDYRQICTVRNSDGTAASTIVNFYLLCLRITDAMRDGHWIFHRSTEKHS